MTRYRNVSKLELQAPVIYVIFMLYYDQSQCVHAPLLCEFILTTHGS